MKDKGLVVSTKNGMAEVEVSCLDACEGCSARSLCAGRVHNKGRLAATNSLYAKPGDHVQIEIPEEDYSKAMISLFGLLLLALLLGVFLGYGASFLLPLSSGLSSLVGLSLGLLIGGYGLFRMFQRKNKQHLYPVITDIIKKGGGYGST